MKNQDDKQSNLKKLNRGMVLNRVFFYDRRTCLKNTVKMFDILREIQIKTSLRFYITPVTMTKVKNKTKQK